MKKTFCFLVLSLVTITLPMYAQSGGEGHTMMGGQSSQQHMKGSDMMGHGKEMMKHQKGEMGQMHMMKGEKMHENLAPCMNKMHDMMGNMNKMMNKEMNEKNRAKMADVMENMSKNMMEMSVMMKKGYCTIEEMDKLNENVSDTQKEFEALDSYL